VFTATYKSGSRRMRETVRARGLGEGRRESKLAP